MSEDLVLSTTVATTPVTIDGKKYTLRELTGKQRDAHLTASGKRIQFDATGKPVRVNEFDNHQAELIALALFTENGESVPLATIEQWPARVQTALFNKAREISGLTTDDAAKVKNDSEASAKTGSV
jgi:hypothetical protein